jgi:hypothetical protein
MSTSPSPQEAVNPKTGRTHTEAKDFVRNPFRGLCGPQKFEDWRSQLRAGFVDHGADVSSGQQHLPAFLFAQFGDVRSVMIAVPGVEE